MLAEQLTAQRCGDDVTFSRLSTDTRTLQQGDMYLALKGENFDGNKFVKQAMDKGACGAIVSDSAESHESPMLVVTQTTLALGKIAQLNRLRSDAVLIALTGSQGKTTVKEMVGSILALAGQTLVTKGNFNNAIGVPLTLLNLSSGHDFAVLELGANAPGEIRYSSNLVSPQIVLITNAASAHLQGFKNLQGVVEAKGEIIDAVDTMGKIILNADDPAFQQWKQRSVNKQLVSFSIENSHSDYRASELKMDERGCFNFAITTPQGKGEISLHFLGRHNVINAVAAIAAAMEAGATLAQSIAGLESMSPVKGRMRSLIGYKQSHLIDDSYNANPDSFEAAIDVLSDYSGEKILIVGDMDEVGDSAEQAHSGIGAYARSKNVNKLFSVGKLSHLSSAAFELGGKHFETKDALICECKSLLDANSTILVKGSRGSAMEDIVNALRLRGAA